MLSLLLKIYDILFHNLSTDKRRLCDKLSDNADDISSLFENLAGNFADVVQYNKDNRKSETRNITIDVVCDAMIGKKSRAKSESVSISWITTDSPTVLAQECSW